MWCFGWRGWQTLRILLVTRVHLVKTDVCHVFALCYQGSSFHRPHYLQPQSPALGEEDQSCYSTSMTLHPPLCLWCRLRPPALKKVQRELQLANYHLHTGAVNMSGEHGSEVHCLKIKQQEVWCHNERSPSTSQTSSDLSLRRCEIVCMWACEVCVCVRACVMKTRVSVHANVCNLSHTIYLFFAQHLHTPLLGVMQEAAVAQINSSLSYWLAASRGRN